MSNDWIDELKVGDQVAISGTYWRPPQIAKVTRRTKTQVHAGGYRWNKYGRQVGSQSDYSALRIEPVTDQTKKKVIRFKLQRWIYDLNARVASDKNPPWKLLKKWRKELAEWDREGTDDA